MPALAGAFVTGTPIALQFGLMQLLGSAPEYCSQLLRQHLRECVATGRRIELADFELAAEVFPRDLVLLASLELLLMPSASVPSAGAARKASSISDAAPAC